MEINAFVQHHKLKTWKGLIDKYMWHVGKQVNRRLCWMAVWLVTSRCCCCYPGWLASQSSRDYLASEWSCCTIYVFTLRILLPVLLPASAASRHDDDDDEWCHW
eukprot:GHVU01096071.1.p2 GENE.GHVU01096071.1~~GHVU01096071.1.p2  ORF type:complete len:104 (-),score=6.42 GHVU01096071.1:903-1214(-)